MKHVAGLTTAMMLAASLAMSAGADVTEDPAISAVSPLVVTVTGFRGATGNLLVGLYADEASWDGGNSVRSVRVAVDGDVITFQFDDLEPGLYGLKMYQDVDGNDALDRSAMGIPTEPYGFSNNARGAFGPASWSDASFTLSAGENSHEVTIR